MELRTEDFENRYLWRSCCCKLDRRALLFATQFVISVFVLLFAMSEITFGRDADSCAYMNVITSLLGYWLPSPKL